MPPPSPLPALGWIALALAALGLVVGVGLWWRRRPRGEEAEARQVRADIVEGRYHLAVPWLLKHGRIAEAARLEALRGHTDRAAELYEQAGDVRGAASVFRTMSDHAMAALVLEEAGLNREAAGAFAQAGRLERAAALYEGEGFHEEALTCLREAGDTTGEARLLERLGRTGAASRAHARAAEDHGRWAEAAALWEQLGETASAAEAWRRGGDPVRAGRLLLARGDHEAAAPLLQEGGDHEGAAEAFAKQGRHTEAARAFYRGGRVSQAIRLLTEGEDWTTLARIYLQHGRQDAAHAALVRVPDGDPRWEDAQSLLVELYRRTDRGAEALKALEGLVRRRITDGPVDASVRRWTVQMSEILYQAGRRTEALSRLRKLEPLGLLTPELEEQIEAVERTPNPAEGATLPSTLGLPNHDRYEFLERVGEGGNGVIYRAVDKTLGRELAIKMVGQTALPSDVAKRYFLREAQTAAQLNHPNIVTVYDMGEIEGRSYIAMELIEGESLADRLAGTSGRMSPVALMPLVEKLCRALDYAHERGVIHRDVKLENVMLTRDGDVKLMDFGLAKAIHGSPDKSLILTGTPLYMSPEQIAGREVDHRTDIYALGVLVYRLLVGRWPYFGDRILDQHQTAPVPDPCAVNRDLPAAFAPVIRRVLAKEPDDRYGTAGAFARDMHRVFRD